MLVAICIKIAFILSGLLTAGLAISCLVRRTSTPIFTIIWIIAGATLIISGIFIEPYNWSSVIGVPTIIFIGILGLSAIVLFWYLTKKIDEVQRKFKEMVIQLTLLRDKNDNLEKELSEIKNTVAKNKSEIELIKSNSLKMFSNNHFLADSVIKNKKILFVNNTLSTGGAEKLLLQTLQLFINHGNNVHLYIMTGMGELINKVPKGVTILNEHFDSSSVLSKEGKKKLKSQVINAESKNFTGLKLAGYSLKALARMLKNGEVHAEKLAWRAISETAPLINDEYDIAIAFTEGASTYYVADRVKAKHKISFVHISYEQAGYTKQLDKNSYDSIDEILTVSDEVRQSFIKVHPECANKVRIQEYKIEKKTLDNLSASKFEKEVPWDLSDKSYQVIKRKTARILTVSRLVSQKGYELMIDAAKILKDKDYNFSWIALGEGEDRSFIQNKINSLGLNGHFKLLGNVNNPYPYMKNCDVYVHATKFEGKSISVQEAKALGCAIVLSFAPGNQDQIVDKETGLYCQLDAHDIADKIAYLIDNPEIAKELGNNAKASM